MSKSKISHGSNMMWEGSRFMLPEHVKALNAYEHEKKRQHRPYFDDQQLEEFNHAIQKALHSKKTVRITVFGSFGSRNIKCVIKGLDQHSGHLIVSSGDDIERIRLIDVLSISE